LTRRVARCFLARPRAQTRDSVDAVRASAYSSIMRCRSSGLNAYISSSVTDRQAR
jgi:hypothetical protein